jgi:hypothetical protein
MTESASSPSFELGLRLWKSCRLLPANLPHRISKRGLGEKCFQLDFCFRRKEFRFRLRSWELKRCGKCDKRIRSSLEISSRARCAGHRTSRSIIRDARKWAEISRLSRPLVQNCCVRCAATKREHQGCPMHGLSANRGIYKLTIAVRLLLRHNASLPC